MIRKSRNLAPAGAGARRPASTGGKALALIASLSLLLIGLVGVGLASPAAAAPGVPPTCPAVQIVGPTGGITTTTTWTLNGVSCVGTVVMTRPANEVPGAPTCPTGYTLDPIENECENDALELEVRPTPGPTTYNCMFGSEEWDYVVSHICTMNGTPEAADPTCAAGTHLVGELCFPDAIEPTNTVTLTCEAGVTVDLSGYPEGYTVTIDAGNYIQDENDRLVFRAPVTDPYHYASGPLGSQDYVEVTVFGPSEYEDVIFDDGVDCGQASAVLTCTSGWTASLTDYLDNYDVRVTVDGEVVTDGEVMVDGAWSGNGPTSFTDGEHTMQLQAGYDGETREWLTVETDSVSCTPPPPACTTDCGGTTTVTTEVPPAVVAPAVVAPAVVDVPAVVAVPAAATVAAPAPATVTVPQAATLPSAVPAGDGSSAPASGVPVWALAMLIAGALGAISIRMTGSRTE